MAKSEFCTFCGAAQAPHPVSWQNDMIWLCDSCYINECHTVMREMLSVAKWVQGVQYIEFQTQFEPLRDLIWDVTVKLPDMIDSLHLPEVMSTFEPGDLLDEGDVPF